MQRMSGSWKLKIRQMSHQLGRQLLYCFVGRFSVSVCVCFHVVKALGACFRLLCTG